MAKYTPSRYYTVWAEGGGVLTVRAASADRAADVFVKAYDPPAPEAGSYFVEMHVARGKRAYDEVIATIVRRVDPIPPGDGWDAEWNTTTLDGLTRRGVVSYRRA